MHAVWWHIVHIGTDSQPSRHAVAVDRVIPPKIVIVVVTSAWPIVITTSARPVGTTVARSVGATIARPTRKAIVYVGASVKTSTRPVITTASGGSMMKAIAYLSTTAVAAAPEVATAAAAAAAAPPSVAVINGQNQHRYGQRTCCKTPNNRPRLEEHDIS